MSTVDRRTSAPQAAQAGAGSNIPADPAGSTPPAEGRDRGGPAASGSSLADHAGARGGNSRRTDHSLFSEKNAR